MLVIIKSPPGSPGAQRGIDLAREEAADILLMEAAAALARKGALEGYCGTAFVLRDDLLRTGMREDEWEQSVKALSGEELSELIGQQEKVQGPF